MKFKSDLHENQGYKVLIVDDDKVIRSFVRMALEGDGFIVSEAASGNEALRKVAVSKPDLILLDLMMPEMDGYETCRRLRSEVDGLSIPIIILSAKGEKDDILKGFDAGANDYMIKPIEPFELRARMKTHLRLKGLYESANAERRDLITLLEVSQAVSSSLHSRDILYTIVKSIAEFVEVARCSIVKIGKDGDIGHVITTFENPNIKDLPIELDKYPEIRKALNVKGTVIIDDIYTDPLLKDVREYLKGLNFNSLLVVPIMVRDEVVGTLFLRTSRREKSFTPREVKLCQVIANMAGNALANAHLFESMELANLELERLAITDGLTGVYNHRHFRRRLDEEFVRARRYKTDLSCIMLDIDYFKHINDAFGHAQGDIVLKEIADLIGDQVRSIDLVARYGGEEFVIILPQTDKEGAYHQAERIRQAVKSYRCTGSDRCIMVTISAGVCTFPSEKIASADDLVGSADKALYEAKRSGRDRTISAV